MLRRRVLVAVGLCATFCVSTANSAPPYDDPLSLAAASGEIDHDEYLVQKLLRSRRRWLGDPSYRVVTSASETPFVCGTTLSLEIARRYNSLTPRQRILVDEALRRPRTESDSALTSMEKPTYNRDSNLPDDLYSNNEESTVIAHVYYDSNDLTQAEAQEIANSAQTAYETYLDLGFSYRRPDSGNDINIYVSTDYDQAGAPFTQPVDLGGVGEGLVIEGTSGKHKDLSCKAWIGVLPSLVHGSGSFWDEMRTWVIAHEVFHVFQFGYNGLEDVWIMEATANWAAEKAFPSADAAYTYRSSDNATSRSTSG